MADGARTRRFAPANNIPVQTSSVLLDAVDSRSSNTVHNSRSTPDSSDAPLLYAHYVVVRGKVDLPTQTHYL